MITCTIARTHANAVAVDLMEHAGYKARIMAAERLIDNGSVHSLPVGTVIPVVPIYCLPGCPEEWVREAGTYVVPVRPDIGLWFDWTMNPEYTTAVVPSVKGCNPITGRKLEGCQMEQYRDCCPIHEVPFAHGCYCPECWYSHPPQNYVAHPDRLWVDGFYQVKDGTVRQFFYTAETARDIASLAIGPKNTVPAFGFAFFKYKHDPPAQRIIERGIYSNSDFTKGMLTTPWSDVLKNSILCSYTSDNVENLCSTTLARCDAKSECVSTFYANAKAQCSFASDDESRVYNGNPNKRFAMNHRFDDVDDVVDDVENRVDEKSRSVLKEVSIGGGAAICQKLTVDKRPLDEYHVEPQATMRIYFVFEDQFHDIVTRGGIRTINETEGGWMNGMPVGN